MGPGSAVPDGDRERRVLIIECVPKSDDRREGLMLYEFLHMVEVGGVSLLTVSNKSDLIEFLEDGVSLQGYDHIHLSGHGKAAGVDTPYFQLPRGRMSPYEFPGGCFEGKTVALSACELGRRGFVRQFKGQTGADVVIAPQREVLFVDAAVWFVNYYYLLLGQGTMASTAFERTQAHLRPRLRGAFQYL